MWVPLCLAPQQVLCLPYFVKLPKKSVLRKKRICNGAKPKPPNRKWLTLGDEIYWWKPKIHACTPSQTKPRHKLGPLSSRHALSNRKRRAQLGRVGGLYKNNRFYPGGGCLFFFFPRKSLSLLKWRVFSKI